MGSKSVDVDDDLVVRFVDKILRDAVNANASRIFIQQTSTSCTVQFEIDGTITDVQSPPRQLGHKSKARLRLLSKPGDILAGQRILKREAVPGVVSEFRIVEDRDQYTIQVSSPCDAGS